MYLLNRILFYYKAISQDLFKKFGICIFATRELMQQETLRELAIVLTATIRRNASIDWQIKESVRAKLKVAVKRLLRKYGYPPDMQLLATEQNKQPKEGSSDL